MSVDSDARLSLGRLLRKFREERGWKRRQLAKETGLKDRVIIRLEHGVVNPSRHDFMRVIKTLDLPAKERSEAGRLLRVIHPEKQRKFHLPTCILRHPNRIR